MIVLVCGGRDYADMRRLFRYLDRFHARYHITLLVHGDADGADKLAKGWALVNDVPQQPCPANWKVHGRGAGPIRNRSMHDEYRPKVVISFPGGGGTADMITYAKSKGTRVIQLQRNLDYLNS